MHRHCLKIAGSHIAAKHIQIGLALVGTVDLRVTQNLRVGCGGNPVGIADVLIVLICGVINRSVPVPVDVDRTTKFCILETRVVDAQIIAAESIMPMIVTMVLVLFFFRLSKVTLLKTFICGSPRLW